MLGISETKPPDVALQQIRAAQGERCALPGEAGKDVYEPSWPMTVLGLGCVKARRRGKLIEENSPRVTSPRQEVTWALRRNPSRGLKVRQEDRQAGTASA
jgi:hypothetical protein